MKPSNQKKKIVQAKKRLKKASIVATKRFGLLFGYSKHDFYPLHRMRFLTLRPKFMRDTSPQWAAELPKLVAKHYPGVLILGNGPSFQKLGAEEFQKLQAAGWLTIGLNRSILRFVTDILVWADIQTLDDLVSLPVLKSPLSQEMIVLQTVHPKGTKSQAMIQQWKLGRDLDDFPGPKLFLLRTVLTSALHLSRKLNVPKILLCGVDLDNREYFYTNNNFDAKQPYEQRSAKLIEKLFGGYETTDIIAELLASLAKAGHSIRYLGDSQFLRNLDSVERIELGEPLDEFVSN